MEEEEVMLAMMEEDPVEVKERTRKFWPWWDTTLWFIMKKKKE